MLFTSTSTKDRRQLTLPPTNMEVEFTRSLVFGTSSFEHAHLSLLPCLLEGGYVLPSTKRLLQPVEPPATPLERSDIRSAEWSGFFGPSDGPVTGGLVHLSHEPECTHVRPVYGLNSKKYPEVVDVNSPTMSANTHVNRFCFQSHNESPHFAWGTLPTHVYHP